MVAINIILIWTKHSLKNSENVKDKNGRDPKDREKIIGSRIESVKDQEAQKGGSHE
jgi:hypothetical protein